MGYEGIRITGNTFWLEKGIWKDFSDYEATINSKIKKHNIIALCTYSLDKCGAFELINVVCNHQSALIKQNGRWEIIESKEYKKVEADLQKSREQYWTLFNSMCEGFALFDVICDADGVLSDIQFIDVNPAFEKVSGLKREEVIGRTLLEFAPRSDPSWIKAIGQPALTGNSSHFEKYSAVTGRFYEIFAYSPALGQSAILFIDISQRKEAEKLLSNANTLLTQMVEERTSELQTAYESLQNEMAKRNCFEEELLNVIEEERIRIGQGLHDYVQKELIDVGLMVKKLHQNLTDNSLANEAKRISGLLTDIVKQTMEITSGLCSVDIQAEGGFINTLKNMASRWTEFFGIPCYFECRQPLLINDTISMHLFRIAQETVNNAVKHGNASNIYITLDSQDNTLCLSIRDNGIGMQDGTKQEQGLGLRMMKYRARIIGGSLTIEQLRAGGTQVTCSVPVSKLKQIPGTGITC